MLRIVCCVDKIFGFWVVLFYLPDVWESFHVAIALGQRSIILLVEIANYGICQFVRVAFFDLANVAFSNCQHAGVVLCCLRRQHLFPLVNVRGG